MMNTKGFFYPEGTDFSDAEEKAFAREDLVYNVTEDLLVFLEDTDISKKELARRLGKSKSYVTQILSGSRNMTLGSFSDICFALGFKPEINIPLRDEPEEKTRVDDYWLTFEKVFPKSKQDLVKVESNIIDRRNPEHWVKAA